MSKIELQTDLGPSIATKPRAAQYVEEAWLVEDPWGSASLYGTKPQVLKLMRERIATNGGEEVGPRVPDDDEDEEDEDFEPLDDDDEEAR